jgi:hypothetical protein
MLAQVLIAEAAFVVRWKDLKVPSGRSPRRSCRSGRGGPKASMRFCRFSICAGCRQPASDRSSASRLRPHLLEVLARTRAHPQLPYPHCFDSALAAARESEVRWIRGDVRALEGIPTRLLMKDNRAIENTPVVDKLLAAGAVLPRDHAPGSGPNAYAM